MILCLRSIHDLTGLATTAHRTFGDIQIEPPERDSCRDVRRLTLLCRAMNACLSETHWRSHLEGPCDIAETESEVLVALVALAELVEELPRSYELAIDVVVHAFERTEGTKDGTCAGVGKGQP